MRTRTPLVLMVVMVLALLLAAGAWAQEPTPAPPVPTPPVEPAPPPAEPPPVPPPPPLVDWSTIAWRTVIAGLINGGLVLLAVQVIKVLIPWFKIRAPWMLPLIAMVAAPFLSMFQSLMADLVGFPIDLAPILGPYTDALAIFTGGTAVAFHQMKQQAEAPEHRLAAVQKRIAALEAMRKRR